MELDRLILRDDQWAKLEPHCLGKRSDPGRTGGDNRLFLEAVLWIARTGSPWRDLPGSPRAGRNRGTQRQAIGRSKGGMTTKIVALTDALGNLVRFVLLPGQRCDIIGVPPLIENLAFDGLMTDKAFDTNAIVAELDTRGAMVVISQHPGRAIKRQIDAELYKWRHLIENFLCKLKELKRIAMRSDKTDQSFAAMIYPASAVINSR